MLLRNVNLDKFHTRQGINGERRRRVTQYEVPDVTPEHLCEFFEERDLENPSTGLGTHLASQYFTKRFVEDLEERTRLKGEEIVFNDRYRSGDLHARSENGGHSLVIIDSSGNYHTRIHYAFRLIGSEKSEIILCDLKTGSYPDFSDRPFKKYDALKRIIPDEHMGFLYVFTKDSYEQAVRQRRKRKEGIITILNRQFAHFLVLSIERKELREIGEETMKLSRVAQDERISESLKK